MIVIIQKICSKLSSSVLAAPGRFWRPESGNQLVTKHTPTNTLAKILTWLISSKLFKNRYNWSNQIDYNIPRWKPRTSSFEIISLEISMTIFVWKLYKKSGTQEMCVWNFLHRKLSITIILFCSPGRSLTVLMNYNLNPLHTSLSWCLSNAAWTVCWLFADLSR